MTTLHEFSTLTAAFADQSDHIDICAGVARDHPQQGTLADAAASENSNPLPQTASEQPVDRANTGLKRLANRITGQWIRRLGIQILAIEHERHWALINRPA